jgi:hypothetical protein
LLLTTRHRRTDFLIFVQIFTVVFDVRLNTATHRNIHHTTMPAIKVEESPEPPIANIAHTVYSGKSSFFSHVFREPRASQEEDVKPSMQQSSSPAPNPRAVVKQAHVATGTGKSTQTDKYSWLSPQSNFPAAAPRSKPAVFASRLSSERRPAVATDRVNKTTTPMIRTSTGAKPPTLHTPSLSTQHTDLIESAIATGQDIRMEEANYETSDEQRDQGMSAFPNMGMDRTHYFPTDVLAKTDSN